MVQQGGPEAQNRQPRVRTPAGMFIRDLPEGTKLRLADGAIVQVLENANDGGWLFARYLEHPEDSALIGTEEWIFFGDVAEQVE